MDYQGPDAVDIRNTRALNLSYLAAIRPLNDVGEATGRMLTELQARRLSMTPFLLFSLREQDVEFWDEVFADDPQADLLETTASPAIHELQVAALGFLWQLSRQRPYVARLVSGATAHWCDRLGALTLVELIRMAAHRSDLIVPRFPEGDKVIDRLLQSGISAKRNLQEMSQQFALQAMLTRSRPPRYERLPAAACDRSTPIRQVADRGGRKSLNSKV